MSKVKYGEAVTYDELYEEEAEHRVLGWCESCGMEVYTNDDALKVIANGDIIHSACWDFYAAEHPEFFTQSADTREEC